MTPDRDPIPDVVWRRSLRASRARRAAAERRHRRSLRGRSTVVVAALATAGLAGGAVAQERLEPSGEGQQAAATTGGVDVRAVQRRLGVVADGVVGPQTRRAVRRFQRANGLTVDGIVGPQTQAALGLPAGAPVAPAAGGAQEATAEPSTAAPLRTAATLERIARCESGGRATAVSSDGRYRGKYQFDRSTWRALGGKGDPAAAPEAEQDRLAGRLLRSSGTSPWPSCG